MIACQDLESTDVTGETAATFCECGSSRLQLTLMSKCFCWQFELLSHIPGNPRQLFHTPARQQSPKAAFSELLSQWQSDSLLLPHFLFVGA